MQGKFVGLAFGMMMVVAGCGQTPAATVPPVSAPAAARAVSAAPAPGPFQAATAPIAYRNPRVPFHSDRIELKSGSFVNADDGMGPAGDAEFFYDGSQFFVIANTHAGSQRGLAVASDSADPRTLTYTQAPQPVQPGASYAIRTPDGYGWIVVDHLASGSMQLDPTTESGSGAGSVSFHYRLAGI